MVWRPISIKQAPDFGGEICVEEDSENDDKSVINPIPDDLFAIYNNVFDSSDDLSDFESFQCPHSDSNSGSSDISTSSENEQ